MNKQISNFSRRKFVGFGLASALAPSVVRGKSPNGKLNMGIIGSGGRGGANLNGVKAENIHTLCDINRKTLEAVQKRFKGAKTTTDWREVVSNPDIDAVVISTADHHHAPAAIAAMRAGKHVYCEKPLAHTVQEARWMQEEYAKAKGKIATQMGTQIHAGGSYRRAVELIQAGAIGRVKEAHVWCSRSISDVEQAVLEKQAVPDYFDWDVWLGPAADRAYNEGYWKGGNLNWNRRWEFGNGVPGDMGSHLIDLAWWALKLRHPTQISSQGPAPDSIGAAPWQEITWQHPDDVKVVWYHGPEGMKRRSEVLQPMVGNDTKISKWGIGVAFVGENGVLVSDYGKNVLSPSSKFKDYQRPQQSIEPSAGHYNEWLKACRGEGETLCNFDYSGSLIEHNLLGNVAHRAGQTLKWDAKNFKITNDEAANKLLTKEYRKGWEING
ncbi:Gfo/Idh/MocA family oxidoreductase [Akkermansiaceae bacterium]|jgi:predicted dehydrogenase|nr:Gfo/Idh/MocA family oxidoreductase [bacterium]MDA7664434.1 Gfo/Idh/MocA family oxidoreductase [Akkermansiaceae bacterium]MDA7516284.1 Gfo/Idh/MocA family oxidoreductase [bacterium]MDA7520344.1 Gfo/Idh/MocA family oxidoreductase [bacterium]MDA7530438.1 Gfo/Idh/MocA family oxidoreductase [bacterium]